MLGPADGAQIAAHLTNAGVDTVLFDLAARKSTPRVVLKALAIWSALARRWPSSRGGAIAPGTTPVLSTRGCYYLEAIAELWTGSRLYRNRAVRPRDHPRQHT